MLHNNEYNTLLCSLHIMWYEYKMINETLDSIEQAINNAGCPVDLIVCLNSQTYIEKPDSGIVPSELFKEFIEHPVLKNATIIEKTDSDPFYNIGDWARDIYGPEYSYKYIVWCESDCLVPEDYLYLLNYIQIQEPHIISLSTRKMWDSTWDEVEHPWINQYPRNGPAIRPEQAPVPYNCTDYITQAELDEFNRKHEPYLIGLNSQKVDGCMTAISKGFPDNFIPNGLHIGGHDFYLELFMKKHNIPQYHIPNRLKGHNQAHPDKRIGTSTTRGSAEYLFYKNQCDNLIADLINN